MLNLSRVHTLRHRSQAGLTLVELMISIALGLLVVLVATALVVSTKTGYLTQSDSIDTQDSARFALDNIARSVRQAGYINYDPASTPLITPGNASADIQGFDASALTGNNPALDGLSKTAVNGSDVLAVRYFGSGSVGSGDGTVLNCAGFSVPAPVTASTADVDRGWSIYYVANDNNNKPELLCKYSSVDNQGNSSWGAASIVKGVESFQVLYGVDNVADGIPNRFLNATQINALDAAIPLVSTTPDEKAKELNRKTYWKKITQIKVSILVRGESNSRADNSTLTYQLFGAEYQNPADTGTQINEANLPTTTQRTIRKVYRTSIQIRNTCNPDPDKGICLPPSA